MSETVTGNPEPFALPRRAFLKGAGVAGLALFVGGDFQTDIWKGFEENIVDPDAQDPSVAHWGGAILSASVKNDAISLAKIDRVRDLAGADYQPVWQASNDDIGVGTHIWAPKIAPATTRDIITYAGMHIPGQLNQYVFGVATDPNGQGRFLGRVDTGENWAIDGSSFLYRDKLYFTWSGKDAPGGLIDQHIFIAEMEDEMTLKSEPVKISSPTHQWERAAKWGVNEAPHAFQADAESPLTINYSANVTFFTDYCLGQLVLQGTNPLDKKAWQKSPTSVFSRTASIPAPGSHSLIQDEEGWWIVYHNKRYLRKGLEREVRAQLISLTDEGTPFLGQPRHTFALVV